MQLQPRIQESSIHHQTTQTMWPTIKQPPHDQQSSRYHTTKNLAAAMQQKIKLQPHNQESKNQAHTYTMGPRIKQPPQQATIRPKIKQPPPSPPSPHNQESTIHHATKNRGSSPKRLGPNHEFGKFGPLRALSKFSHLPHGRRADDSHIFVANHNRRIAINACFCQQYRLQMSKYSPKAFVSASDITFLMRWRKLFAWFLVVAEILLTNVHFEPSKQANSPHRRRWWPATTTAANPNSKRPTPNKRAFVLSIRAVSAAENTQHCLRCARIHS